MSQHGKLIVIVAPSGSGKSTLIKRLKKELPMIEESVSYTTRPMRKGEVDGVSYNFVDVETFKKMRDAGDFIEWAEVHGNFYGSSKSFVESKLAAGSVLLFDLDVQGTDAMKAAFEQTVAIFIAPPNAQELENRLRGRGTDSTGVINLRLLNAKRELERMNDYDHLVVNDDLERAYAELSGIIRGVIES